MRELIRRVEASEFENVAFDRVVRTDIPEDYDATRGSLLAVLEGDEVYTPTTGSVQEMTFELFLSFAVPLAAGEEAQAVANNVAAEVIKAFTGDHTIEEGGKGTGGKKLANGFTPIRTRPDLTDDMDNCAAATVEFQVRYRTRTNDLFAA
ncbi:hypothetical protein [Roseovarius sp. THAF27]|uniref:hypothetical protein n=1 Tax=Roseovarius sp. THAF27 TaxID=2587850 RepID=UPI001268963D|nr:hypothetical protein [Roseovarius sp. THAF27]